MTKYRKKPIVIEAEQHREGSAIVAQGVCCDDACPYINAHVHTIHDSQPTPIVDGDWILGEPDGKHYYPCKPDIFEAAYELVE